MNNEIKEKIPENVRFVLEDVNSNILWNYITNLQQKIEGLEAENETLRSDFKNQVEYTNKIAEENERIEKEWKSKLDDVSMLTSRISKAIEYIQNNMQYDDNIDDNWVMTNDLLNILQNGSDNNE